MVYTNTGLVAHAKQALADNTMYMWGGIYRPITGAYVDTLAKMYPKQYDIARQKKLKTCSDRGYYGIDCVGLIKSYYWGGRGSKGYQGATDVNATGMYTNATRKGPISTLPEQPGLILFCQTHTHVGVYIGNGEVIESTLCNRGDGVVKTKLSAFGWTHWFQCPYITADNVPSESYTVTAVKSGVTVGQLADIKKRFEAYGCKVTVTKN